MKYIRGILLKATLVVLCTLLATFALSSSASAAFNKNLLMSDSYFDSSGSMSAAQIDSFLNGMSSSCIKSNIGFRAVDPTGYSPSTGYTFGGYVTAGTVIYHAAQAYNINPRVLLATLQKEQSLVSGSTCSTLRYTGAMGYGCPDSGTTHSYNGLKLYKINSTVYSSVSGTCVNSASKAGFSQQVIRGAWLLKFGEQRSKGNVNWAIIKPGWDNSDDPQSCYSGPMTRGTWQVCPSGSATYYDGYTTIDGSATFIGSGSTAALYWYTPHFSGNQNFVNIYTAWFGPTTNTCTSTANISTTPSGRRINSYHYSANNIPSLTMTQLNNTGSHCSEAHIWSSSFKSWSTHVATGMNVTDPSSGVLLPANTNGNSQDEVFFLKYGTNLEVHQLSNNLKNFPGIYDVATNLTGVSANTGTFVSGDFDGNGKDELVYIKYSGSGGRVEVHKFSSDLRKAIGIYDVATNLTNVNSSTGTFVAGDFLGRGYSQLVYVLYNGSSGKVETHMFSKDLRKGTGIYDVATNLTNVNSSTGTFVAGDFLGRGYSQLVYVLYNGSSGKVETHMFSKDLRKGTGFQDIVTNLSGIDPSM